MPEFHTRRTFQRWLQEKPREWSIVLGARAGLRAAPMLATAFEPRETGARRVAREIVLPAFRSMAVPWAIGAWGAEGVAIRSAAAAARKSAQVAAREAAPAAYAYGAESRAAVRAAGDAAYAGSVIRVAADAAGAAYAAAAAAANYSRSEMDVWKAVSADASELESAHSMRPVDLAIQHLWPTGIPRWVDENWKKLKTTLERLDEDWDVWTRWYEARLYGASVAGVPIEKVELARVLIPDQVWDEGPKVANAHIRKLIEDYQRQEQDIFDYAWRDEFGATLGSGPAIPAQRRAAIEPTWHDGRLTVSSQPISIDLRQSDFLNALQSLRAGLQSLASDLDGEANIDRRFVAYLRNLAAQIPDGIPPQHQLFELGHAEEVFLKYLSSVNAEWPNILAARFHAMIRQHDNTMRQAPAWREFKRNANRDMITSEEVKGAAPIAAQIAAALREDDAQEFVDPIVPSLLERAVEPLQYLAANETSEEWRLAIQAGHELLALDVIESVNNILKPIAEAAVVYAKGLGEGFKGAAEKQGPRDGEKVFKWLRRLAIGAMGGGGSAVAVANLIAKYPSAFEWLRHVLHFIK